VAGHQADPATARALLGDEDPGVRSAALGALERSGALTPADLAGATADPHPAVRRRAAEVLATRGGGRGGATELRTLLADPDSTVVEVAAWAAGEMGSVPPDVLDRVIELATKDADPLVREAAVAALGAVGDQRGLPAILAATRDKPAVRRRAVIALAPFTGPEVDAALERARTDRDWQVRQSAEDLRE
jgi:HEAT repeat protein